MLPDKISYGSIDLKEKAQRWSYKDHVKSIQCFTYNVHFDNIHKSKPGEVQFIKWFNTYLNKLQ